MLFLLTCVLTVLFCIYIKLKYFTRHGPIPGQSPQFLFGNILQAGLSPGKYIGDVAREFQTKYGDLFQFWLGPTRILFVCNPDDVQHIFTHRQIYEQGNLERDHHRLLFNDALICNIGSKYKRHASFVLPLFRRGKFLNNYDLIIDCTDKLLSHWRTNTKHVHTNIVEQCQNLSLTIFGFIAFDYDLQILDESNGSKNNQLRNALNEFLKFFVLTIPLPTFLSRFYLKFSPTYRRTLSVLNEYLTEIIQQEQSKTSEDITERKRTSLIASLVAALQHDEIEEANKPEEEKKGSSSSVNST